MAKRSKGVKTTQKMGCRTPGKVGYETEEKLLNNLCRFPELYGSKTYKCSCKLWHIATIKRGRKL